MDPLAKKKLEESVAKEAQLFLEEGDHNYIFNLSPSELMEVLEAELGFMGLYSHSDRETPRVIHEILERNLPEWAGMVRVR